MKIIRTIRSMKQYRNAVRKRGKSIGFVPTMGYLHDGHASLIKASSKENDITVASIFVNPAQFGPSEDFDRYPRDLARDKKVARRAGADTVFAPSVKEMYTDGMSSSVNVEGKLTQGLCGKSRPGHFKGVATVVAKLLNIVSPDVSYFGQKDAQQAAVIKKMVKDLNMDTAIKVMPIVREKDGLAMSSRNMYLSPRERKEALGLSSALERARGLIAGGERSAPAVKKKMRAVLSKGRNTRVDYIEICDAENLAPAKRISDNTLIAVAAFVGKTRLIDNLVIRRVSS